MPSRGFIFIRWSIWTAPLLCSSRISLIIRSFLKLEIGEILRLVSPSATPGLKYPLFRHEAEIRGIDLDCSLSMLVQISRVSFALP